LHRLSESKRNLLLRQQQGSPQRLVKAEEEEEEQQQQQQQVTNKISRSDVKECLQLMQNADTYKEWERLSECNIRGHSVKIHRKMRPNSDLYDIYSYGTLPISADQLIDVNWDLDYRVKWDAYAKVICVKDTLRPEMDSWVVDQDMVYWEVAFPWPLANRDYVFYRHTEATKDGLLVLVSKGIEGVTSVPEVPGVVRVEQLRTYFVIKPLERGCEFALLYFDDLKGSIPRSIVNWAVSKAVPAFLNSLVDAAENKNQKKK
jgi:hypothetical protein